MGMNMQIRSAFLVISLVLLTGCAATVKRNSADVAVMQIPQASSAKLVLNIGGSSAAVNANDWEGFKLEWKANFSEQARIAGVAFEMQDGTPRPTGEDGTLLYVCVNTIASCDRAHDTHWGS